MAEKKKTTTPIKQESLDILACMQECGEPMLDMDIAEKVGQAVLSVRPRLNALVKRGLVDKLADKATRKVPDKDGNLVDRQYMQYILTEDGQTYGL